LRKKSLRKKSLRKKDLSKKDLLKKDFGKMPDAAAACRCHAWVFRECATPGLLFGFIIRTYY